MAAYQYSRLESRQGWTIYGLIKALIRPEEGLNKALLRPYIVHPYVPEKGSRGLPRRPPVL